MQRQQWNSRIDIVELKARIVKKIGSENSKRYFYNLNRYLSQKLNKSEFDKSCSRVLGRDNLPLHNLLIVSILKNACNAKTPPQSLTEAGPTKSSVQDRHEQNGTLAQNITIRSNGVVLPPSRKKGRSWKSRDRPSPLGPNGRADSSYLQLMTTENNDSKVMTENGDFTPCDYQRLTKHTQGRTELPENHRVVLKKPSGGQVSLYSKDHSDMDIIEEEKEEVDHGNHLNMYKTPLLAPLGIPNCSASVGGARRALPVASSSSYASYNDSYGLSDTETLKKHMEQIAAVQGVEGVSLECATVLNIMIDVYLKQLINSCVALVRPRKQLSHKQQIQHKHLNGMTLNNHLHIQSSGGAEETKHGQKNGSSISLHDFKVAMELDLLKLGEDWPLLLEKICMRASEKK